MAVGYRGEDGGGALGQPVHPAVEQRDQQGVLAGEVPVDPRADDARLRADVGQPDRVEPAARRELGRGREDAFAALGIAATTGVGRDHLVIMAAGRYGRHK